MSDFLRKGFLLGLGAAVSGKERLEKMLKDLVERNELTQEQAKSLMQHFIEKGEAKTDEWGTKQNEQTMKLAKDMGVATKADVEELHARIAELEEKLNNA